MSKSSKTTTTTTPTNPDWVTSSIKDLSGRIGALSNLDPYSLVTGPNPLQTQAAGAAANLGAGATPGIQGAQGQLQDLISLQKQGAPQIQAASLLDGLSGYMNPFTNDVVNTTLAGFDQNAGLTRAQQQLDLANSGAFGGSGAAIAKAMTEGQLAQQRAATEAGLRSDAFNVGAGLSNSDAARRQDAATTNANLKMQNRQDIASNLGELAQLFAGQDANTRANVQTQGVLGNDLRNIDQQKVMAPISLLQTQAGLTSSLPYDLFHGQTSTSKTTSSDPLGTLGSLAMLAAAPFTGGASLLTSGLASIAPGLSAGIAGLGGIGAGGLSLGDLKAAGMLGR